MKRLLIVIAVVLGICGPVGAIPVLNPNNAHYYEAVPVDSSNPFVNFEEAEIYAESREYLGMKGHLATITSDIDNVWLFTSLGVDPFRYLLGGYQPIDFVEYGDRNSNNFAEGWVWVTGEPWDYTKWAPGEPNNGFERGYTENALIYFGSRALAQPPVWNDVPFSQSELPNYDFIWGYIIEYEPSQTPVPEPSTILLIGVGLVGIAIGRRRFKRKMHN